MTILIIYLYVVEIKLLFVCRFLQGFFEGVTLPLSYVIISEIVPVVMRGKALIVPVVFELLGFTYTIYLGSIYLDDFENGDWKRILLKLAYPSIVVAFGNLLLLKESPRYLISR